jgi:hypothetical protein
LIAVSPRVGSGKADRTIGQPGRQSRQTGLMMWCLAKDGKIIEIDRTSWHPIQSSQQLIILTNPDES